MNYNEKIYDRLRFLSEKKVRKAYRIIEDLEDTLTNDQALKVIDMVDNDKINFFEERFLKEKVEMIYSNILKIEKFDASLTGEIILDDLFRSELPGIRYDREYLEGITNAILECMDNDINIKDINNVFKLKDLNEHSCSFKQHLRRKPIENESETEALQYISKLLIEGKKEKEINLMLDSRLKTSELGYKIISNNFSEDDKDLILSSEKFTSEQLLIISDAIAKKYPEDKINLLLDDNLYTFHTKKIYEGIKKNLSREALSFLSESNYEKFVGSIYNYEENKEISKKLEETLDKYLDTIINHEEIGLSFKDLEKLREHKDNSEFITKYIETQTKYDNEMSL